MSRRFTWAGWPLLLPAAGALVGLLISSLVSAPRGAQHHCPAGAPADACTYPPNVTAWRIEWASGGLIVGLLAIGLAVAFRHRRDRATGHIIGLPRT
jgi:hypothetical protein